MLGTDLLTYQMNPDLTSSIFTGQSILNEDLNEKEIELIKSYLSDIKNIKINTNSISSNFPTNPKLWNSSILNKFFQWIDETIKNGNLNNDNIKLLKESKSKINNIINPQGRFKEMES